jgi:exodeoxyribonuclease V gamma subunit
VTEFEPVADSEKIIGELVALFRKGLEQPLHFFSRSSFEYAEKLLQRSATRQNALSSARKIWGGGDYSKFGHPESQDPYHDLCFRHLDPLDEPFQEIAMTIFKPLLTHCKEIVI